MFKMKYEIAIDYRTTHGGGVWMGSVAAENESAAIERAHAIVRRKHGCRLFRITDTQVKESGWNREPLFEPDTRIVWEDA